MLNCQLRTPDLRGAMNLLRTILVVACCAGLMHVQPARAEVPGPSFDCVKAKTPVETAICADDALKLMDWFLAAVYRDAMTLHPERREVIQEAQRQWIAYRDEVCIEPDLTCLR